MKYVIMGTRQNQYLFLKIKIIIIIKDCLVMMLTKVGQRLRLYFKIKMSIFFQHEHYGNLNVTWPLTLLF